MNKQNGEKQTADRITDLIYCSRKEARELIELYKDAKIKDASDIVHPNRFQIKVQDSKRNYYKALIETGLFGASLMFGISMQTESEAPLIENIISELKDNGVL